MKLALAVPGDRDDDARQAARGAGLLFAPTRAVLTAYRNEEIERHFTVTNTGAAPVVLDPALETLDAPFAGQTQTLQATPATDPTYFNVVGALRAYQTQAFVVPEGADHLDASISFVPTVAGAAKVVAFALLDPSGRQTAYSIPQGAGSGYGHVDVVKPVHGTWTAMFRTSIPPSATSYSGPFEFSWSAEKYTRIGDVFPKHVTVGPGESAELDAHFFAPWNPGDSAAAIRFKGGAHAEIPVTLRTLVEPGEFAGTLTGGNGRAGAFPTQTFTFDVPFGARDVNLGLEIFDPGYTVAGVLVDPKGMTLASASNVDPTGATGVGLQLTHVDPEPGRWRFIVTELAVSGRETSLPFLARLDFDREDVHANLPNSPKTELSLAKGAVTVPVAVTNLGVQAKSYFADARLHGLQTTQLATGACSAATTLPGDCGFTYLPPRTEAVAFLAQSTVPIQLDALFFGGSPELFGRPIGPNTVGAFLSSHEIAFGPWEFLPALIGPFGPTGAPTASVVTAVLATFAPFDAAVTSDTGNFWADQLNGTATYNPLVLAPGQSGTLNLTITPSADASGQVVRGFVLIETQNLNDNSSFGEEIARLPYAYTVKP